MQRRHVGFVILVCCAASTGLALAQAFPGDIHVRTLVERPGCDFEEGRIEVRNSGHPYYKVSIVGTYRNPPGHLNCPACTSSPCDFVPDAQTCLVDVSEELIVNPCDGSGFCTWATHCMPGGAQPNQCPKCDNNMQASGNCPKTCGTELEWCSTYTDLLVRITAYKMTARAAWIPVDEVVCVRGSYETEYEGAAICSANESYCVTHEHVDACEIEGNLETCIEQ